MKKLTGNNIIRTLKTVLAALPAIIVAGEAGLKYYPTAGIIAILSIQNTKRETIQVALNRAGAYAAALLLAAGAYGIMGFTLPAFGVYLFLFIMLCMMLGWEDGIVMNSVLITHFLTERSMTWELILNETLLFVTGVGFGVLVNLHLRRKESLFDGYAQKVDDCIRDILKKIAGQLNGKNYFSGDEFKILDESVKKAKLCAMENYNNDLRSMDERELRYIRMREHQSDVLKDIEESVTKISYTAKQSEQVAELFMHTEQCFHKDNTVAGLLEELEGLFDNMKKQKLPGTREEFESRAVLFYILMQMKTLLQIKREFVLENMQI